MDDIIYEEAKVLCKDYSEIRKNPKKWKVFTRTESTEIPIQWAKERGEILLLISRNKLIIEAYKSKDLFKRGSIRRNLTLLKSILSIWDLINPFHLSGISEKVYRLFYFVLYSSVKKDLFTDDRIEEMVEIDLKVDFGPKTSLGFADFYNGFFEFIDSNTRSALLCEYTRVIAHFSQVTDDIRWGGEVNLYSKAHVGTSTKQVYANWMKDLMQVNEKRKSQILPKMLRTPINFQISGRLISKTQQKRTDVGNFFVTKLEKLITEKLRKKFKPEVLKGDVKKIRKVKSLERVTQTFYSNHIEKISPLSSILKSSRIKQDLLENIINGRKKILEEQGI